MLELSSQKNKKSKYLFTKEEIQEERRDAATEKPKRARRHIKLYIAVWLVTGVLTVGILSAIMEKYYFYADTESGLNSDITALKTEQASLDDQKNYLNSDAFIEEYARDNLGYVKDDEFVFAPAK